MRQVLGWMMVVLLCCGCATGRASGSNPADARLVEAQAEFDEAAKLRDSGEHSKALAHAERALALREAVLGGMHPEVAHCLHLLGVLHVMQGDLARAEPLIQRAIAIREAALGKNHPDLAASLNQLATIYYYQGLYDRAEPLFQRTLAIREAALGKRHPDVANVLNNIANVYARQGLFGQAEPFVQRALAIHEAALGKNHPSVAVSLSNLANLYAEQGLYSRAEPIVQRALAIHEAAFGKDHPLVARMLNNLANLYLAWGLYGRAEPFYQRALAIHEAALGKSHLDVAQSLGNLAVLYAQQGLYGRAEPLYQRALAIAEESFGKNHPDVAQWLNNLATLYLDQELYSQAEPRLQRALAIREEALGKSHPAVALSLNNLAILYAQQGLYGRAEPLYQRALATSEAALGKNHSSVADSLAGLAALYLDQGLYDQAEPLIQRALTIWEEGHGKNHPNVAQSLNISARLQLAQQRLSEALPRFTRALSISEQRLRQEALDFSESRLASFLDYLRKDEQALYALLRAHPEDARVQRLALSAVLLLKGRSVEETASISRTLYQSLGAEDRDVFERLRGLRTRLAALSLDGPGSLTPADYQQRIKKLADEGDALEADLAKRSSSLRARTALPPSTEIVDRVAASLPKDGALVEFIAYVDQPLVPKPGTPHAKTPGQLRYLALVLFPDASTRTLDLGPAAPIDLAATRLHGALASRDARFQASATALYRLAFQPLLPLLGNIRRLFLSPDGQLSLVSFAALHDGRRFLLDSFDFIYLTSGKDLLSRPQEIVPSSSVCVLADPAFTASPRAAPSVPGPTPTQAQPSPSLERFFSTLRSELAPGSWVPLPGTRREAESIQRLLPQAQLFLGAEATKERLLQLPTPGVLHLATHGFFLEDAPTPAAGSRAVGSFNTLGGTSSAHRPQDPLLRSGLALAPAPEPSSPSGLRPDTTLVTALELAGLNLWGTQLVVLSACDTGRGDVRLGQGVAGLRRALMVAGAETLVTSLWKVKDDSTSLLMDTYYRNLLAGQGRASALREAMRSLRASRPHPHHWAPFIALGSDAPLRAITPPAPEAAGR